MHEADDSIMESKEMWATPGSGIKRWGLTGEPTVHVAARAVSARIGLSTALAPPAPRWPPGKTWAVAITHDLDRYRKYRPAEFLRHAGFAAARGKMGVAGDSIAKALISAVGSLIVSDPYVASLDAWVSFQRSLDVRSAIYVSVVARTDQGAAANDVTYSLRDTQFAARIRDLEQEGWEIGLHSSINAWRTEGGFGREREKLRDAFSVSSVGVRGHYWSLDPAHRDESLRRIARAGFRYDSSLGMNLVHGYRRGSNYPYRPFDPTSGEILGVWEVPPVMMDESLLLAGTDNLARDSALRVRAAEVRRHGGLLVLDWHTDSLARGYMDDSAALVLEFLQAAVPDSECWVATPRAIVEWCSRERWSV
jgi:hypothetical protein